YLPDLMARLEADPPFQFVVQKGDRTMHVTGHNFDSVEMLAKIPALRDFVETRYEQVLETAYFDLWELRDAP
ncbi:MAG: hypothetical protein AAF245_04575, partial [Pseudomonadota bacterium]